MASNPRLDDPSAVALQSWVNDQLIAAEKLMSSQLRDLEKLVNVQLRDLKEHSDKIQAEKDKALSAALSSAEKAVQKAEENAERWRANANEWRGAMNDKDRLLVTRPEFETYKSGVSAALQVEKQRADIDQGKGQGLNAGWIILVGAVGLIATIVVTAIAIVSRLR